MKTADPVLAYPTFPSSIPDVMDTAGAYALRFARTADDLDRVTKLRFEVFNLELSEGLAQSWRTCRDHDEFDAQCHHMMVVHTETEEVVGTYRLQTAEMARAGRGFYSDAEFDLATLGDEFLSQAVELGRACVALSHRNSRVLFLLWRGLAKYVFHNGHRYFFGCCSLTSQDPDEAWHVRQKLIRREQMHPTLSAAPRPEVACFGPDYTPPAETEDAFIPRLMRTYLDYGARIAGDPVIDRDFKTIDFLAVFDMESITPRVRRLFVD
ncbi:MAG: GNAT family N-acyltransferase [Pseudomonadota bacterium]